MRGRLAFARWASRSAPGPLGALVLLAGVAGGAALVASTGGDPALPSSGMPPVASLVDAASRPSAGSGVAPSTLAQTVDEAGLEALVTSMARHWQREPLPRQGRAADPALLSDSLSRLRPWLLRRPQAVWSRLPDLGPSALPLWTALLLSELNMDASLAWRHALQLSQRHPAWTGDIVAPLLAPMWQRREFELLLRELDGLPLDADLRERWRTDTAMRWAEAAPAQTAAWAARGGSGTADLLAQIQDRWINQDARSATVFASMLPRGAGQALLEESLSRWLALDGVGARDWILSQGSQEGLDRVIAAHATQDELVRHQPLEAIALVRRISDPDRRDEAQWALARTLGEIDATRTDLIDQALWGARPPH